MASALTSRDKAVLQNLNARRFDLLLTAAKLPTPFTAHHIRAAAPEHSTSLNRDLNALEASGLLLGDPSAAEPRQGTEVKYHLDPDAIVMLARLPELLAAAVTSRKSLS